VITLRPYQQVALLETTGRALPHFTTCSPRLRKAAKTKAASIAICSGLRKSFTPTEANRRSLTSSAPSPRPAGESSQSGRFWMLSRTPKLVRGRRDSKLRFVELRHGRWSIKSGSDP
jgi:hypothetical protein